MSNDLLEQLQATLGDAYTLEHELAGGGMSRVFVATDMKLGRKVVVKVLAVEMAGEAGIARFRREIRLAANLQHPHIVPVISAGETNGLPYFIMPFIPGDSLRERLKKSGEFPIDEALRILRELASALAYAHSYGIVHRDIKPENILVSGGSAMVTDFGVAKAISASVFSEGRGVTSVGVALGTPAYMSPEQASADPDTDHRSDIYSLGILGYEMLAGSPPFAGRTPAAMLAAQVAQKPEPITQRRPTVPPLLAVLIMKCIEKRAADRPQSAQDVMQHLDAVHAASTASTFASPSPVRQADGGAGISKAGAATTLVGVGRSRRFYAVAIVLALAGLGGLTWYAASRLLTVGPPPVSPSVAVLPFVDLGGGGANEYLGDGLSDQLISALSKAKELKVAARTSSFAFKGKNDDVRIIASKLGVANVLQGSIRRIGGRLRVTAQLTSAETGFNLWAETFDRDFTDVFTVQDEITFAIVSALKGTLAPNERTLLHSRTSKDVEAYDIYLKGLYEFNRRGRDGLQRALAFYRKAIELDSTYAPAYAGLALAYTASGSWAFLTPRAVEDSARLYAKKAIALDPRSAEANVALGDVLWKDFDFNGGERAIRNAMQLNPSYALAPYVLSWRISPFGRFDEATALAQRAHVLDPLNPQVYAAVAKAHYLARRYDEGLELWKAKDSLPDAAVTHGWRSHFFRAKGDGARALSEAKLGVDLSGNSPVFLGIYANALRQVGQRDSADRIVRSLENLPGRPSFAIAWYYALGGDKAQTVAWLKSAYDEHSDWMTMLALAPDFDGYRRDPEIVALLNKLNMSTIHPRASREQ